MQKVNTSINWRESASRRIIAALCSSYSSISHAVCELVDNAVDAMGDQECTINILLDKPGNRIVVESVGGMGSGPSPFDLLSAALATCTTMTLRLYADGKGWPVTRIRTAVGHERQPGDARPDLFNCRIAIEGAIDAEQRTRMMDIAARCPVHRTLDQGSRFTLAEGEPPAPCDPPEAHRKAMERATEGPATDGAA